MEAALAYHPDDLARRKFAHRLESALEHVQSFPGTLTRRPDLTSAEVYFWPVKPFWLVVRKETGGLTLVAVPHCSRDIRRLID